VQHRMGLPWQVGQVCFYGGPELREGPLFAIVTPAPTGDAFDAKVVDRAGNRYLELTGYRTVTFRENIDAGLLRRLEVVSA